jgi:hypothetical protein
MLALSVQTEEHGTSTHNLANAQSHQLGTVLLVLSALVVEFTATSPTNANAQAAKPTTGSSALSTVQRASFTATL